MPAGPDTSGSQATVRSGPVLAIVLASYTMIVLDTGHVRARVRHRALG